MEDVMQNRWVKKWQVFNSGGEMLLIMPMFSIVKMTMLLPASCDGLLNSCRRTEETKTKWKGKKTIWNVDWIKICSKESLNPDREMRPRLKVRPIVLPSVLGQNTKCDHFNSPCRELIHAAMWTKSSKLPEWINNKKGWNSRGLKTTQ